MAKGDKDQRSNGSRFTKSYNASNSFVTKVASRVSDYLGGWFGAPLKRSRDAEVETRDATPANASGDTAEKRLFENADARRSAFLPHRIFDDADALSSPAKRFKVSDNEKVDIDFPVSPIPSTSGLFRGSNHAFEGPKAEDFEARDPGPSSLGPGTFRGAEDGGPHTSAATEVKANGAADNHSDSSESTSGCSSLVPQSDRLSQSAYAGSARKRNLDKLKYARQLQQSRLYLNRSIPVNDASGTRKKPSFDVTVYGSPSVDKSFLREKLINSPFYTGQTSYGGASAYRLSRSAFISQRNQRAPSEKREGTKVQVRPSHHGSTEDLSNMSHTAKKILEALEQFSTPVNDAKRIPVGRANVPLGAKRRRCDELTETRLTLATPISPLNPNPGPVISGLNVPTVPDLLKLKRLERIQNSTAAARQAVREQEYRLPSEKPPAKRTGKIVTKLKNKEKDVPLEKLEEVNLPKIPLPITTLPKFDFQLPAMPKAAEEKTEKKEEQRSKNFVFSPPIAISVQEMPEASVQKKNFIFSKPLNANEKNEEVSEPKQKMSSPLVNFMSSDAVAKLKRKSISDGIVKSVVPPVPYELKTGSVIDYLKKYADAKEAGVKPASETWECTNCLIRNINDNKICQGCKSNKVTRTLSAVTKGDAVVADSKPAPAFGFGDKFKPPVGSWSCKECFVSNAVTSTKCVACETPKQSSLSTDRSLDEAPAKSPVQTLPKPTHNGFGDLFKKRADQWECSVCMIRNKESDAKCAACETPRSGASTEKTQLKFTFGMPAGATGSTGFPAVSSEGFKFGIDKAGTEATTGVKSAADSSTFKLNSNGGQGDPKRPSQFNAISTSVGVFTFGIPAAKKEKEETKVEAPKPPKAVETSGSFLVTSTSGSNLQKEDTQPEKKPEVARSLEATDVKSSDAGKITFGKPFVFGAALKSPPKPPEENKEASSATKSPAFVFGIPPNSAASETVTSSTTDFAFGHGKPIAGQSKPLDSPASAPLPVPRLAPIAPSATAPHTDSRPPDETKNDSLVSTSAPAPATTTTLPFAPSSASLFNAPPKITFGNASATAPDLGFGSGTSSTAAASLFAHSAPVYAPSTTSFNIAPQAPEKSNAFGSGSTSFSVVPTSFGSAGDSSQNLDPPKSFSNFGTNASMTTFGVTPTSAPAFGAGFIQPSSASEKPPAPASMFFGAAPPSSTTAPAPAPAVTAPGVFTFGAAQPEPKPTSTFGQSSAPGFSFGSNAPSTNFFGGFGQPKQESSLGTAVSVFGSTGSGMFGQNSAPPAFEPAAPKFDFGGSSAQQQDAKSSVFQFGATPAQPASAPQQDAKPSVFQFGAAPAQRQDPKTSLFQFGAAPAQTTSAQHQDGKPAVFQFGATSAQPDSAPIGQGFSLTVPQKFNFTGGQPTAPSATSDTKTPNRKVIKAMRRTNRDQTRRQQ